MQETTKLRQSKKIEEEQFKERCRYYRSYEEDLVVAYEKIEDELKVCNQTKESYRRDCSEMREEMTNVLKELENWKKETADTEKKEKLKLRRRQVEMASFLSKKQSLREDLNRRDAETALIVESITNEINKRHNHLKVLDEESANLRKKLTQIKNAQIKHYLDLLKEGKDTRSEGLL